MATEATKGVEEIPQDGPVASDSQVDSSTNDDDGGHNASSGNLESLGVSPFEQAIKVWTSIDLGTLQKLLDGQGMEIVQNQTNSVVGRKELAEKTKAFRKMNDEGKLSEIKGLLKLYQGEIDNLTNRGKFAENCFMNVYKHLSEAPDPRPLLEASVDSVVASSNMAEVVAENSRLNELLGRYADYETVKAKLLKVEMESIENTAAKVAAKEAEMNAVMDEKERSWKMKEEEMAKTIEELRANHEVTQAQLTAQSTDKDPSQVNSRLAELELVASELDRANTRVLQVEKRNVELRSELEMIKSGANDKSVKQELENQLHELQGENSILAAKIESSRSLLSTTRNASQGRITSLEMEVKRRSQEIDSLKEKLHSQRDYDDIKRELDILKSIELITANDDDDNNDNDDDDNDDDDDDDAAATGDKDDEDNNKSNSNDLDDHKKVGDRSKNLEKMLLARNKKLNSKLTELRVQNGDLKAALTKSDHDVRQLDSELENLKELNNRLEEDLMSMRQDTDHYSASLAPSMVSGWTRTGKVSPTSSIINGNMTTTTTPSVLTHNQREKQPAGSSDNSILPIVTQQRDRFRARNNELEEELRKSWAVVSSLRKEIESVKKDNMELYERTRYAASFNRRDATAAVETKYREAYEEGLTAFEQFKGREAERALSRMGPLERVLYSFTRLILANRVTRNLFLGYCLGLHMLVMVMLMHTMGQVGDLADNNAIELAAEPIKR